MIAVRLEAKGHRFDLEYTEGGRLAEVYIDGKLVDATSVGNWDWQASAQRTPLTTTDLSQELAQWIAETGDDYLRELPYL